MESKGIDPAKTEMMITRAENGWIVFGGRDWERGGGEAQTRHVARTPTELAELVREWAQKQNDGVKA